MNYLAIIVGGFVVTFLERYPMLALAGRLKLPDPVTRALKYVPPAVLAAIIVPDVLLRGDALAIRADNARLVAAVVATLVIWRTKNLLLTIVVGMAVMLGWTAVVH